MPQEPSRHQNKTSRRLCQAAFGLRHFHLNRTAHLQHSPLAFYQRSKAQTQDCRTMASTNHVNNTGSGSRGADQTPWLWIAILAIASIALSSKLSCATPFAALATLAALQMKRTDGALMIGVVWLANQAVGYGFLNYPHEAQSYAWGLAIGVAALAAFGAATLASQQFARSGRMSMTALSLAAAFVVYEVVLFAVTAILPASEAAFALPVVAQIGIVNAVVLPALFGLHYVAVGLGIMQEPASA
jgi:hypothetical protein